MEREIQISVFCLAFNHEKYIRQCLDGFVMQKTDFAFEVLIHDDASTDGTAAIIREYEERYPEIIKPTYQSVNQYSQHIPIIRTHLLPRAKGRFLAWCEGDDYWTDPYKLQKQYDFLSGHPDYALCVHRAVKHDLRRGGESFFPDISEDRDYSPEEIIRHGGGGIFSTNSIVIRREAYTTMPSCFDAVGFGDYQIFIYGAICGKCRCLYDAMSVYNLGADNSWTMRTLSAAPTARIDGLRRVMHMLEAVDTFYNGKYHEAISGTITDSLQPQEFDLLLSAEDYREAMEKRFRPQRRERKPLFRLYIFLRAYFPGVYAFLKKGLHGTE